MCRQLILPGSRADSFFLFFFFFDFCIIISSIFLFYVETPYLVQVDCLGGMHNLQKYENCNKQLTLVVSRSCVM